MTRRNKGFIAAVALTVGMVSTGSVIAENHKHSEKAHHKVINENSSGENRELHREAVKVHVMKNNRKEYRMRKARGGDSFDLAYFSEVLDLSKEQSDEIKQIGKEHMAVWRSERRNVEASGDGIQAIRSGKVTPDSPDYENVLNSAADQAADRARNKVLRMGSLTASIYTVLTPEQQVKMNELHRHHFNAKQGKSD